jgi:hypothetical protein
MLPPTALDFVPCSFLDRGMAYLLRTMRGQDRIEGREPLDWDENDYAVVDDIQFGRIYMERIHGKMKWHWFLQTMPAPPPNSGVTDTLDETKAALLKRYEEVKRSRK